MVDTNLPNFLFGCHLFFSWGALGEYLRRTSFPDEVSGYTIPMNFHGTIGYITQTESNFFYILPALGFLVLLVLAITHFLTREK